MYFKYVFQLHVFQLLHNTGNRLPITLTSQSSLLTSRQQLKTFLFEQSYSRHPCNIAIDTNFSRFNFFDIVTCP